MPKYKVSVGRRSGSRALATHGTLAEAQKDAKKRANRYNRAYYIHKYHVPEPPAYPFWSYHETIFPTKKKGKK